MDQAALRFAVILTSLCLLSSERRGMHHHGLGCLRGGVLVSDVVLGEDSLTARREMKLIWYLIPRIQVYSRWKVEKGKLYSSTHKKA